MNELDIYQIFQNIFDQSKVINGQFSIATRYGGSLDDEKVGEYITNTLKPKRYPLAALFPPVDVPGDKINSMKFKLLFLVQEGNDTKGIKKPLSNNTSGHLIIYDWKDMVDCAYNFIKVIKELSKITPRQFSIKTEMIERFSQSSTARLSGAALSFSMEILNTNCENNEYEINDFRDLLQTKDIHPQHTH